VGPKIPWAWIGTRTESQHGLETHSCCLFLIALFPDIWIFRERFFLLLSRVSRTVQT